MKIACPECAQRYEFDEAWLGRKVECSCGKKFVFEKPAELEQASIAELTRETPAAVQQVVRESGEVQVRDSSEAGGKLVGTVIVVVLLVAATLFVLLGREQTPVNEQVESGGMINASEPVDAIGGNEKAVPLEPIVEPVVELSVAYSELWDRGGANSVLPDYSFAGYAFGDAQIPEAGSSPTSVLDFGATPNDDSDDTVAIQKALDRGGYVRIPAGRYRIRDILRFGKSGTVLVGPKKGVAELVVTRSLTDVEPKPTKNSGGTPTSSYSWSGGFIEMRGPN